MGLWPSQTQNAMVSVSDRTRAGRAGNGLGMKMKEGNWSFHYDGLNAPIRNTNQKNRLNF